MTLPVLLSISCIPYTQLYFTGWIVILCGPGYCWINKFASSYHVWIVDEIKSKTKNKKWRKIKNHTVKMKKEFGVVGRGFSAVPPPNRQTWRESSSNPTPQSVLDVSGRFLHSYAQLSILVLAWSLRTLSLDQTLPSICVCSTCIDPRPEHSPFEQSRFLPESCSFPTHQLCLFVRVLLTELRWFLSAYRFRWVGIFASYNALCLFSSHAARRCVAPS